MNYPAHTTQLLDLLDLEHPLIQAPMAGVSNTRLAAAVASAGALGSLGLGGGDPQVVDATFAKLAQLTNRPVNLNFFVHEQATQDTQRERDWLQQLEPLFTALGAKPPATLSAPYGSFDDNPDTLAALLAAKARVVSFHFGLPAKQTMQALHKSGTLVLASATSAAEAKRLQAGGADIVIAQGWEAGGHRGRFTAADISRDERLSTFALLPQVCAAVDVPVIAAGGIGTGAAAAAALQLGAAGVALGTAFVTCPESSANSAYRSALLTQNRQTLMTAAFSGREARGLENTFTAAVHDLAGNAPDYPIAYDAGKALAAAAIAHKDESLIQEHSAMWAGQSFRSNRVLPAAELVELLVSEMQAALG